MVVAQLPVTLIVDLETVLHFEHQLPRTQLRLGS